MLIWAEGPFFNILLIWAQGPFFNNSRTPGPGNAIASTATTNRPNRRDIFNSPRHRSRKSLESHEICCGIDVVSFRPMPTGPRLNIRNGIYHVMTRGNRKGQVFEDDRDRVRFIDIVAEAAERYEVRVFAESRLGNHYHQVVQTPRANLPSFMRYVNAGFTQYSNYRHGRIGHLFNGPYRPILIDNGNYLRVATGYVVMNAVNHGFVDAPEEWRWSSYRANVGLEAPPDYLCLDWLDEAFPARCRLESQKRFRDYLTARTWAEGEEWLTKPLAGSTEFERELREHIGATLFMAALPKSYRMINRPALSELFHATMGKAERNRQMLRAHVLHAYSLSEIARALCMHPGSVSRIVASLRRTAKDCRRC